MSKAPRKKELDLEDVQTARLQVATSLGGIGGTAFRSLVRDGFRRRQPESPIEWMPKHIRFPDGWEETRFDFDKCPHVRGFIELFVLDPAKRKANLPWATRLAKTTTLEGLVMWKADQDPVPMAALFPDNDSLAAVDDHLYPVFEACAPINAQLLPKHLRNKRAVRLRDCTIRLASGGKKSSVSGFPSQWVVKFEHDKTNLRKSTEGDPSARLDSRTSGFCRNVKIMEEGTPCDKHDSRAWRLMNNPDVQQVHYWVQCPHCKQFQVLHHDNIEWNKNEHGKSEAGLAERTAWYQCVHKGCRIEDHHRTVMMQSGKWLIEGQRIDKTGKISGTPKVESDTMVFGPLSKLYSLLIKGWGTIAAELVTARHSWALGDDKAIRKCYAETLGLPWDPQRRTVRTNDLAVRLRCDDHPERGVIPPWASFLTFTCDVGKITEELIFYWMVVAWGGDQRGAVVDWDIWQGREHFLKQWTEATYVLGEESFKLFGQPSCIDSGNFTHEVCDLCKPIRNCYPCKGDTNSKVVDFYWPGYQRQGLSSRELELKKKANAHDLMFINSNRTQEWRVALTEGRLREKDGTILPGFVSLPADVCDSWQDHENMLEELTADSFVEGKWVGENNEWGDTLRYARALAECFTGNGKRWGKLPALSNSSRTGPRFFSRSGSAPADPNRQHFVQGFR